MTDGETDTLSPRRLEILIDNRIGRDPMELIAVNSGENQGPFNYNTEGIFSGLGLSKGFTLLIRPRSTAPW